MWVIFRDPQSIFTHMDKYVVDIVTDEDILNYQNFLMSKYPGAIPYAILPTVRFLQPFLKTSDDIDYFVRKYEMWTLTDQ